LINEKIYNIYCINIINEWRKIIILYL
jgi:hypothetical protein